MKEPGLQWYLLLQLAPAMATLRMPVQQHCLGLLQEPVAGEGPSALPEPWSPPASAAAAF